jgi:preprotein translocase subunit SecD
MNTKQFLKEWRIWLLILVVLYSVFTILAPTESGITITSISQNSPLRGDLSIGDKIDWINEKTISTPSDLDEFETFTGVLRYNKNGKLTLTNIETPGLGIGASESEQETLNLGMDLIGGTRVLLEPVENISSGEFEQTLATLESRINFYGLKEMKFQSVTDISGNNYIQIEIAGGSLQEIEDLLSKQGMFEGKIAKPVTLENGKGTFWGKTIEECNTNSEEAIENCITIDGTKITNETFTTINNIEFTLLGIQNSSAYLLGTAFTSDDIESVCMHDQQGVCASRLMPRSNGYEFNFQVFITQEGANNFAELTKDSKKIVDADGSYLDSKLYLFLDGEILDELTISSDLAGKAYREPLITGFREDQEEANNEMKRMKSILQTKLPVELNVVKADQISASLGKDFINSAILAGILAALAVSVVVFIRYRKIKIAIPVLITSLSEVIIILGAAATIKYTIDLAALAGIIAAVGTGVDSQIMIIDEILMRTSEETKTLKQRIKQAFFIIMGSATTTIAAMVPLMIIGIGVMRGFAIVATIGVLIGIFITRPAFGRIAEILIGNEPINDKEHN